MHNYRLLTVVNGFFFAAIGVTAPLITLYLEVLGASYAHISLILTSFVLSMLVSNYLWGRLSDRMGRRKPLLMAGLFGLAAAYAGLSQAPTANWAWAMRVLEGAGSAAYITLSLAIIGDALERSDAKGRQMGVFRGIGSLAFAGGALIGGRFADAYSLPQTFLLAALFPLLAGVTALGLHPARPSVSTPKTERNSTTPAARGLPLLFLAGVVLWMAAHSASTSMWPNYMATLGYSKTAISSLWGLAAFTEMPFMYAAGVLSDLMGRALLLAAGGVAIALVQLGYILLARYLPALMGVQVLRGFGFASYTTTAMTYTTEQGDRRARGGASGIFYTAASAGQLLGMFMGGVLAQTWGFVTLYVVCGLLAATSGLCFLVLRRNG